MEYFKVIGATLFIFYLTFVEGSKDDCAALTDCKPCLKYNETTCFWCPLREECMEKDSILPTGCKLDWRYFDNCSVPGYVWVVVFPAVGFIILVAIVCACGCCCCRCSRGNEEAKFEREKMELKAKYAERRAERRLKRDEILKKYGKG